MENGYFAFLNPPPLGEVEYHIDNKIFLCECIPFIGALSQRGFNPIKLAYHHVGQMVG